jgi:dsRNA-specific ribonuclease
MTNYIETKYLTEGFKIINNLGEEEIIQIPYNENNIAISENDVYNILKQFDVNVDKINNISEFVKAFTHKSYTKKKIFPEQVLIDAKNELNNSSTLLELQDESYERLEFYGDSVFKCIVSKYLFKRYPNENEGFLTRLRTKIEDKNNLSIFSKKLGLGKFFIISKQIENMNGRNLDKIHEDVFEAFIAALDLNLGYAVCYYLITNLLETSVDYSQLLYCDNNYKDALLRYHHSKEWTHPIYKPIYHEGPPHKRKYIVGVEKCDAVTELNFQKRFIGFGIGNSIKEGSQKAAKMALIIYGLLNEDQYANYDLFYPTWNEIGPIENDVIQSSKHYIDDILSKNQELNIKNQELEQELSDHDSVYSDKSV